MKISIVTISYNQAEFLERAIVSVISQQGVDLEYIVVDPGSTDGSRDIIERYRDRIAIAILDRDDGPADGLNRGLAKATGEIFGYLNADDMLAPGALREAVDAFTAYPDSAVVYGNGWRIDEHDLPTKHLISSPRISAQLMAREQAWIVQQAAFIRTAALRGAGGFNTGNTTSWDGEAFLAIARNGGRFRRVWRDWGLFRIHSASISGSGRLYERYRVDCDRLFAETFGRPRRGWEGRANALKGKFSQFADPRGLWAKLRDRVATSASRRRSMR